jgi:hypothetical protein
MLAAAMDLINFIIIPVSDVRMASFSISDR